MRFILILIIFFITPSFLFSQLTVSELDREEHLIQLKNGILFVQIPRIESKKIKLLNDSNSDKNKALAKTIESENKQLQEDVKNGFIKSYDYSQFYFIETSATKLLLQGDYQNITIKDVHGNLIDFQPDSTKMHYLASYGPATVPGDTDKYNGDGILIRYINKGKIERLKTNSFFESSERFFSFLVGLKTMEDVISKLNDRFHKLN